MDRAAMDSPDLCETSLAEWPDAEVILLTVFRCWLAGYETSEISCWELAWDGLSRVLPVVDAKHILAELGQFTRIFRSKLVRRFVYLPHCCGRATIDECLALRLASCAQRGELSVARQVARRICGSDDHADVVQAASDLAVALRQAGLQLTSSGTLERRCSAALH
jgi:hypothetical protein